LFPLGVVLLPDEVMPLHIFEPRYRAMVARCIASSEPFCVVLEDDTGRRDTGCLAEDIEVLERFADERLNIAVTGGDPVTIEATDAASHSFLAARASSLVDTTEPASETAAASALAAYRELAALAEGEGAPPEPEPGPRLSYAIAGRIQFDPAIKQQLLEDRSEPSRLAAVTGLMQRATATLTAQRTIRDRAHSNGRVSPPESSD
jgi:Lon protease-like protein